MITSFVVGDQNKIPTNDTLRSIGIAALIGVIKLVGGPYLIIMKSRVRVGEIGLRPHIIWQLNEFELIPFHRSLLYLNEKQVKPSCFLIIYLAFSIDSCNSK